MKLNEGLLKMAKISAYWLECLGGLHSEEIGLRADGHQYGCIYQKLRRGGGFLIALSWGLYI